MNCFAEIVIAKNMQNIDNMLIFSFIVVWINFMQIYKKKVIWAIGEFYKFYVLLIGGSKSFCIKFVF